MKYSLMLIMPLCSQPFRFLMLAGVQALCRWNLQQGTLDCAGGSMVENLF